MDINGDLEWRRGDGEQRMARGCLFPVAFSSCIGYLKTLSENDYSIVWSTIKYEEYADGLLGFETRRLRG